MKFPLPLFACTLLAACCLVNSADAADAYPSRPVKIVVNTAPGGYVDVTTRLVAQQMADYLKQPVIVENRAGGDGLIAIRSVKTAPADGYTLLSSAGTMAQQMALRVEPGYDLLKDFTGVGAINRTPFLVVVSPTKDRSFTDFVARARANPGKLTYASAGVGTTSHFGAALMLYQLGLDLAHIPYKGNGPAIPDVISGRVDMMFDSYASGGSHVRSGQFRALAVTSPARHPSLPDVPAVAEVGLPGFAFYTWVGFVAPVGTPPDVVQKLSDAIRHAKATQAVKDRFRLEGADVMDMTPEQFNRFLAQEIATAQKLVLDARIPKQ